jgi:hypothetical protein
MYKLFCIFIGLVFLILFASVGHAASIEFEEILSITVPGLADIEKVEFGDVDFDGHLDLLVCDGDSVFLYSYHRGEILFKYALGSLGGQPHVSDTAYDILLSDINRDYIPDVAVGVHDYFDMSPGWFRIFFQNGTSFYGPIDTSTTEFQTNPADLFFMSPVLGIFDAVDFDADGYREFVFSCDSSYETSGFYTDAGALKGITRIYHSFPDSLLYQDDNFYADAEPLPEPNDDAVVLHRKSDSYDHTWGSGVYRSSSGTEYVIMINLYESMQNPERSGPQLEYSQSYCDWSYTFITSVVKCMGDLDINHGGIEAAINTEYSNCCADGGGWDCTSTGFGDALHSINNPSSPDFIGSLNTTEGANNYIYLPDHPGYFCAFVDNRFVQFNGTDGSEVQSTDFIPSGTKFWKYPFNDGQPYLVTLNSNTVSIHKPAIITDVDDDNKPIPTTFSLGQPYPNPFNASQTIPVTNKPGETLTIDVYNLLGQKVACIYSGVSYSEKLNINWNADKLASGVYLIRAKSGEQSAVVRSILMK